VVRAGSRSPIDDLTVLRTELALADLGTLEKQKAPRANATPEEQERWPVIEKLRPQLEQLDLKKTVDLTADERVLVRSFSLLTLKPSLLVINVDEDALSVTVATDDPSLAGGLENADTAIRLCAKLEAQMADLAPDEKQELLQAYGVNEPILDKLIRSTYRELGLITFLTAGEKEARAWPILAGTRAPQAAGTIYSDFETGFIRAKVADYDDFITDGGWLGLKESGRIRTEGKDYVMEEGDVTEFLISNS